MRRFAETPCAAPCLSQLIRALVVAFLLVGSFGYGQQLQCSVELIPGVDSIAAINSRGELAGVFFAGTGNHAFKFTHGQLIDLGTLGGPHSWAWDINDRGDVVGAAVASHFNWSLHAFLFSSSGMRDLGSLDPANPSAWSIAYGINGRGLIVGRGAIGNTAHAFLYEDGSFRDLGTLGGSYSGANAINDRGVIVGFSAVEGDLSYHAFKWENGQLSDLGTLGGNFSSASAVNNSGTIVGTSTTETGEWHAFSYEHGKMSDLGSVPAGSVTAESINQKGWAVGHAEFGPAYDQHTPFLFAAGKQFDLARCSPGLVLFFARDINDSGHIAADVVREGEGASKAYVVRLLSRPHPD